MANNQDKTQDQAQDESHRARAPVVRASLDEAIAWLDAHGARLGYEEIELGEAAGRVVASEIQAPAPLPPFDRAAADGFALRAADTVGAGDYNPLSLALCEPGDVLPASAAAPIVAGAALPRGADAILPFDLAQASGVRLEVFGAVPQGWGIAREGRQLPAGAALVEAGRVLRPQHIGLLASQGIRQVQVVRRPRVRLFVFPAKTHGSKTNTANTGAPGSAPRSFAALTWEGAGDANTPMLRALVERDGGVITETKSETAPRGFSAETLARALTSSGADLTLVAGRSGHGRDDEAARVLSPQQANPGPAGDPGLAETGELAIHGIALRPGGSAGMGVVNAAPVLLLPGDPLECWSAYEMLAGRLIRRMGGHSTELPYGRQEAEVGHKIVSAIGVVDLCRVRLAQGTIEPLGPADSGGLASAVRADGFVLVPAPLEGFAPGTRLAVFVF